MCSQINREGDYSVNRSALDAAVRDVCEEGGESSLPYKPLSAAILADARAAQNQGLTEHQWKQCWTWRICKKWSQHSMYV